MPEEEIEVAQSQRPNLYDSVPGASPRTPPTTTPGGTPIGPPSGAFFEPKTSKPGPELDKSLQGADKDLQSARDMSKQHPASKEDLDGWYQSLSPKQRELADKYQDELKKRGINGGWFDPKISGDMLKFRDWLFGNTSQHWRNSMERKQRKAPKSENPADKLFGKDKEKRSELKDDAPALAKIGGSYMEGGDEPAEAEA